MVFKWFLLSRFHLVFLPTTLGSLPSGVILLIRSTAPRDSATDIEKTSQKGTLERERPNRSVVKKGIFIFGVRLLLLLKNGHVRSKFFPHCLQKYCFFIRFYFIHFSRLNSISIILFWENTGSASENYLVFEISNHSFYFSM